MTACRLAGAGEGPRAGIRVAEGVGVTRPAAGIALAAGIRVVGRREVEAIHERGKYEWWDEWREYHWRRKLDDGGNTTGGGNTSSGGNSTSGGNTTATRRCR